LIIKTLQFFHKIRKADIVKVFSFTAISTLVRMITGFITVKVVAVTIGPTGIALLGQLNNFSNITMTVASGGINNGITKYVAEYKDSPSKIRLFLSTALQITLILSIICSFALIFLSGFLSKLILLDIKYKYVFVLFGISLILYSLNLYLMSILNGLKEFKKYVKINIISSIIGLIFTLGLVWLMGLEGALISAVTSQSIIFFLTLIMLIKSPWFILKNFQIRISIPILKKYLHFSLMTLVTAATVPVSQLMVRSYVISNLTINEAGWWEAMNRISNMYLMIITSSFSVYYLPRLAELKDNSEIRKEIYTSYKIILPVLILGFIGIYLFRDFIIHLLFSSEFFPMRDLFLWQLIGDLFKISSWLLAFLMIAKSMTGLFIITEILSSVLFVGFSIFLINIHGLIGITQAYTLNYFIYLLIMLIVFRKMLFSKKTILSKKINNPAIVN